MALTQYIVTFQTADIAAESLQPRRVVISEGLSEWCKCDIDVVLANAEPIEVRGLLRKSADVLILRADTGALVRRFSGLVTKVRERLPRKDEPHFFTLTIESLLHVLSLSSDFKVFLDKTTKDIVSDIVADAAIPSSNVEWRLSGSYVKRHACAQWGERMMSFAERLLEDDGIFFYAIHGSEPKIVFGDSGSAYEPIPGEPSVHFSPELNEFADGSIQTLTRLAAARPAKVTVRDHDFTKPSLDLTKDAAGKAPLGREHYVYPGGYTDPSEGTRRAKARLAAMDAEGTLVRGTGRVFRMTAGHTFTIADPPPWADGIEWVARRVRHEWAQGDGSSDEYQATFDLLPKTQAFHPPLKTPRPRVYGPHTALVSGPSGEEIHCDEHGRIKVHYTWDRHGKQDDKSSGWVRVGQMHTSGSVVIPRAGWEVLVEFEDGNPDNPIVIGRVYNGAAMPPQSLPGAKTSSSLKSFSSPGGGGHNEITMNDGGGSEVISVNAQKDMNLVVANNKEEKVTNNATIGIGANQAQKIGANQTVKIGANDALTVSGGQKHTVGAARTKTVSGDEQIEVKGKRSMTIGAAHTIMTPKSADCTTASSFTETVGASCLEVAALGVSWAVAGSASITVGAAKVEAVAAGKGDMTLGARASTIGGALMNITGKDCVTTTSGSKATTVGGAWLAAAGGNTEFSSDAAIKINVGGAVIVNGATIILKVGGSTVTLTAGNVVLDSKEVKLTASGPNAELAPLVGSK